MQGSIPFASEFGIYQTLYILGQSGALFDQQTTASNLNQPGQLSVLTLFPDHKTQISLLYKLLETHLNGRIRLLDICSTA
jgi:hypothetical protein